MLTMTSEESTPSRDLKPSPELFEMIQAAASSLTGFAQLWESIRKKGTREGFTDRELQEMLRPLLRDKLGMSKDKIYYLFHQEEKKEQSKESYHRNIPPISPKKEPEETYKPDPDWNNEQEIQKIGEIRRDLGKQDAEEEDAQALEIAFLKEQNAELQEALKKTEQFKPATELENRTVASLLDKEVFDWLAKRDDGINFHWYDGYGIELFKTRVLTQLKGKGVTTFKRLYFEV